ncbi:hypothetical protein [Halorhabdus salina]|nr:hypothetical protein [Halorhabdus salina]
MTTNRSYDLLNVIDTIHPFPTFCEAFKRACQAFRRDVSTMSCCVE